MINFVIIGAAGYIGVRHMEAIKHVGGNLLAVCDPSDSIGIIDSYSKDVQYFPTIELLDQYLENKTVDYVVVCSPNYLHYAHIKWGLNIGADVICEKPLVIDPEDIDKLIKLEKETGHKVHPVLQLRLHPVFLELKKYIKIKKDYQITLFYSARRGDWYKKSWKTDTNKSGGLLINIGIHGLDLLLNVFGSVKESSDFFPIGKSIVSAIIFFKKASCFFRVSIKDKSSLRIINISKKGGTPFKGFDFSKGFEDLHNLLYSKIIKGKWNIDLKSLKPLIDLCTCYIK